MLQSLGSTQDIVGTIFLDSMVVLNDGPTVSYKMINS